MPQFFYPQGKPVESKTVTEFNDDVERVFGPATGKSLAKEEFGPVATDIFKFPKIFSDMLFARIEQK